MDLATTAIGVGAVGLLVYAWKRATAASSIPGPGRYPLVGSYFHVKQPMDEYLYEHYKDEPLVAVHFGTCKVFYLNTYSSVKEAYISQADVFAGRPFAEVFGNLMSNDDSKVPGSIGLTDGYVWKEYRRLALKSLRDFGLGRKGAEERVSEEVASLLETINAAKGDAIDTQTLISSSVSNVICQLVFGSRLASEEPRFGELLDILSSIAINENSFMTVAFLLSMENSWLKHFSGIVAYVVKKGMKDQLKQLRELLDFCKDQVERHKKEYQEGSEARDFIDVHIGYEKTAEHPELYTSDKLAILIADLFSAGTDTTANTLRWAVLFMIQNPQVAEKIFDEVRTEIGVERLPTMADKGKLSLTVAAIEEVLRLSSLVPSGINHRCTEDTTVAGYTIPKNSIFFTSVYTIHRDPKVFPEPLKFKPERFLDSNGRFCPIENMMPFGVGRRACLGESLARTELFLFFTALMQRYTFQLDPEDSRTVQELLDKPFTGVNALRALRKHKIIFKSRQ